MVGVLFLVGKVEKNLLGLEIYYLFSILGKSWWDCVFLDPFIFLAGWVGFSWNVYAEWADL